MRVFKEFNPQDAIGYECKHAIHCGAPDDHPDLHFIKGVVHVKTKDGIEYIPHKQLKENFKRSFFISKEGIQKTHQQKKEWEHIDNLREFDSTESEILRRVANLTGKGWKDKLTKRDVYSSSYVYGADIPSTTILKNNYRVKYPDTISPYEVAVFDIETDVVEGSEHILTASLTYKNRAITCVLRDFVKGFVDPERMIRDMADRHIGSVLKERKLDWEIRVVDTPFEIVDLCMRKAHEWSPDFVAIWNIDFDLPKIVATVEAAGFRPADIFSDPIVPKPYRFFKYNEGSRKKITASGKLTPKSPSEQWHTATMPASFRFVDAMSAYRLLRTSKPSEASYSLDFILTKFLGKGKLGFKESEHLEGLDLHVFMQENFKLEYIVYNLFDCIGIELLDEITTDLSIALPMHCENADLEIANSQPNVNVIKLYFFLRKFENHVLASFGGRIDDELDEMTLDLRNWIVTLAAFLVADNGLKIIKEAPTVSTNVRGHVGDLDVSGSYPNGQGAFNGSKDTTRKEMSRIEGISEYDQRMQGINLSGGHVNAVEFTTVLFNMPTLLESLAKFKEENPQYA